MFNSTYSRLLTIIAVFLSLGAVIVTSKLVNAQAQNPSHDVQLSQQSSSSASDKQARWVGSLVPNYEIDKYTVLPPGGKITGRLGLPAAQLIDPPAELAQEIAVWSPPKGEPLPPDAVGYEFVSSIRYRGDGHTIYVSTARPTPAAAKRKYVLGKPDKLADGTVVGTSVDCQSAPAQSNEGSFCIEGSPTPNAVVFTRGNLTITVASDLPLEQIKSLAKNASLK